MTNLVNKAIGQLEIPWGSALESPSQSDWEFRWRAIMSRCDGIMDVIRVSDEYDPDDDRMMFLWKQALEHCYNHNKDNASKNK